MRTSLNSSFLEQSATLHLKGPGIPWADTLLGYANGICLSILNLTSIHPRHRINCIKCESQSGVTALMAAVVGASPTVSPETKLATVKLLLERKKWTAADGSTATLNLSSRRLKDGANVLHLAVDFADGACITEVIKAVKETDQLSVLTAKTVSARCRADGLLSPSVSQ